MRIAVAGARGQLGAAVVHAFASGHEVIPLVREDLDIADDHAVVSAMERLRPDAVINCAAYNDVDGAEDHPVEALTVNAFGVRALAGGAAAIGAVFVHYGSDFVFDGMAARPYTEDDRPDPRSVYAASKLLGEWFAADAPRWYVLRVESLFGHVPGGRGDKGSVAGIVKKLMAGEETIVFADRTVSPTYVVDAANATRHLLEHAAPSVCITASIPVTTRGRLWRSKSRANLVLSRGWCRSGWPTWRSARSGRNTVRCRTGSWWRPAL